MQTRSRETPLIHPENSVCLRPFPYPYRAALALSSDIDRCDRRTFIALHQYLNGASQGLALPVADSFFGVGRACGHMAYFADDGETLSPDAPLIRACLENGLIDTLHSWGAFDRHPPEPAFIRRTAERLTSVCLSAGYKIQVLSAHGGPLNRHNLFARTGPTFQGDDPASPYYTGDLVQDLGIRYYWASELLPWPLSPVHSRGLAEILRVWQNSVKNIVKSALGKKRQIRSGNQLMTLVYPMTLRDGGRLMGFTRCNAQPEGLWGIPTRHTLRYVLRPDFLDRLVRVRGFMIVYTHLGMPPRTEAPLFPDADRIALEDLAARYHDGAIWVARTVDVLNYWTARHHLDWSFRVDESGVRIDIAAIQDPRAGRRTPEKHELAGLCFYSSRPRDTRLFLEDVELPVVFHPPDDTGQACVGVALPDAPDIGFLKQFAGP